MTSSTVCNIEGWENPKTIILSNGLSPLRSLGQNFLIEKNTLIYICNQANITLDDAILEIGPGTGALTFFLNQTEAQLMCVEYDKGLAKILKQQYNSESTEIIHGDILRSKKELNASAVEYINSQRGHGKRIKIISNLPYKILSPLLWVLMDIKDLWHECIFLVQKEFADKLVAPINSKDYTPLTILSKLYFDVSLLKKVSPKQFWPQPNVTSAIIKIKAKENIGLIDEDFVIFLKNAFSQRRKSLQKLLKPIYSKNSIIEKSYSSLKLKQNTRAEELNPIQLQNLFKLLHV
jgi:16S rRNA (adenine1518-N6/adenine1519-N6)-dimethyltransferase